jgi:hypothetical protein
VSYQGAIVGGIKKIRCYTPSVSWDAFNIPADCPQYAEEQNNIQQQQEKQLSIAKNSAPTVPKLGNTMQYKIAWTSTVAGRTYDYLHFQYYDLENQRHR